MGLFKRVFKIGEAEAHAIVDKLEDPIKMTEQAIRDLKENLVESIKALAEVKALAIRSKNESNNHKSKAQDYENKALMLLQKAQAGQLDPTEADKLAESALAKKDEHNRNLAVSLENQKKYDASVAKLENQVENLKKNISKWENEANILKARAKVSKATKEVNKQLAGVDSSSTVAMLERMKQKVDQDEAMSESYAEIADSNISVDDEINTALENSSTSSSDALAALKAKLALNSGDVEDV
ncbi:MAG: PspA/IM30 family protein [Bacteroidales bacterium]|nr:PspA/IM30 family protein [Bacteroidales bacterium]MBN2757273.1 PspA/IM30 family protein [Bacteroidales bacterium]